MPKNHYTDDRIQKMLPKEKDDQLEYTGMKINKHFLLCGGTGTGKTNALYDYIVQTSKPKNGTFKKIFVCYKTDEVLYDDLKEQLKGGIQFIRSVGEFPSVDTFSDLSKDNRDKYLVVFDDCVNDKQKKDYDKIRKYFTYGRKKGITICYLTQSFFDADPFLRKQMSYLLLLSIKGRRDLTAILKDYGGLDIDKDVLYQIYKIATTPDADSDMPFLKINTEKCDDNKKFSRDWNQYIEYK